MSCSGKKNAIDNEGGAQTRILIGGPTLSQPSQQHHFMLIAVTDDSIGPHWDIYTRQTRLASKGRPRARVVQGSRHHRYDIDYDIIGYDIDYDIMTMIS